ncbi:SIR2 family NAD-dependent protein deacylase [Peribacillus acanthi]|uniref:SIR2 family NAD-dependent protein deacylase n=1 Tax=Peribacillus acanthi TaxID=2171554 RepID=UPI000D3ED954|nr:SIR2 family protein [Peribacillus acanthi]
MTKDLNKFFKENLTMYPHLRVIRDNLWSKDKKSRVSVMIGAGFSLNAKKIEDGFSEIALWFDLKNKLVKNLSHHPDIKYKDVLEVGQLYVDEYGRASLEEVLKEAIPDDNYEPDTLHYKLLNLPWADIFTTNYDTLLERAKRNVYERNYQVVYDVNDIPSSTPPRIIKLHGSFPSNRPFIFTKKDYDIYPEKFSPFVNMVQQSIMETTFVLLGFSGDDPNFERWSTWVRNNLGEHMPKIYMIGYGQKKRQGELSSKGITLIDFQDIYSSVENPYQVMFSDLFNFLAYKDREEKTKWPHRSYRQINLSLADIKYNRETFPGWIIMPDEIRRLNADYIRIYAKQKLDNITTLNNKDCLEYLNEILWCFEKFYIPLDYLMHQKLKQLISDLGKNITKNHLLILFFLLQEARLDCNKKEFNEYKALIEEIPLNRLQKHRFIYEQTLFSLAFNNISEVESSLNEWQVGEKEIEWGIKKAAILMEISREAEAKIILEDYLQTIRSLLAIQSDEYRLLSLESVALHTLKKINKKSDYGDERLRTLNSNNCNSKKEFNHTLISVKKYEYTIGTKETPGFDPGRGKISSSMGDYIKQELLDAYAILQIKESFYFSVSDKGQYGLALKNLEIIYPLYSLIKRIHTIKLKEIDDIFSREFVYRINDSNLEILIEMLKDRIEQESSSIIEIDVVLEIISRLYFSLPKNLKLELDLKIIEFLNSEQSIKLNNVLVKLIERIIFDKNTEEKKIFCEQLMESNLNNELNTNKNLYRVEFFEPFLVLFSETKNISNLNVPENKILEMISFLNNDVDQSYRESALIRMTFLEETKSLTENQRNKFIKCLTQLSTDRDQGISNYIFKSVYDRIINSSSEISEKGIEVFLTREIPTFYNYKEEFKGKSFSSSNSLEDYFHELSGVFPDYIGKRTKNPPNEVYYHQWLDKFYLWWEDQEEGLLRDINEEHIFLPLPDYLKSVVIFLKNNVLGVISKQSLRNEDIEKFKDFFEKINNNREDLSIYLVPSFERLNIPIGYSLEIIINYLSSKEINKFKAAASIMYDYLVFIENKEIKKDCGLIKSELFRMMYYGSEGIFKIAVDNLKYCMKNIPNIFTEDECELLANFLNEFLKSIMNEKIVISTLKDFEMISSVSGLVSYLYQNKNFIAKEVLSQWREFIEKHRLPEVRKYSDLLSMSSKVE